MNIQLCPCGKKYKGEYHTPEEHQCRCCKRYGYDHTLKDCPYRCPCMKRHTQDKHECMLCGLVGFDHHMSRCPQKCLCGLPFTHAVDFHTTPKTQPRKIAGGYILTNVE